MASTLKNESRQAVVVLLDHPAFLNRASGWHRSTAKFASTDENGTRLVEEVRRSYPGSLTLQPGEEVSGLHDAITGCSQVEGLIASKVLSVRPDAKQEKNAEVSS